VRKASEVTAGLRRRSSARRRSTVGPLGQSTDGQTVSPSTTLVFFERGKFGCVEVVWAYECSCSMLLRFCWELGYYHCP